MELIRNSVWSRVTDSSLNYLPTCFRIIQIHGQFDLAVIFAISENKTKLSRPIPFSLKRLDQLRADNKVVAGQFDLPVFMTLPENDLEEKWKEDRDNRYDLISPLVEDDQFIIRMVTAKQFSEIVNHAKTVEKHTSTIHRFLNLYWRYGQQPNALIPFHDNCGGRGVEKRASNKRRGAPSKKILFGFPENVSINITEEDKVILRKGIKKYYGVPDKKKSKALEEILTEYYSDEINAAERVGRKPQVISLRQFYYWLPKLSNEVDIEKMRLGKTQWEMNHRGLLGSVSENVHGPGDRFEIDATIADVYIVSEFDRNRILGRPVIYVIVDEASRMVAGLHVSIFWASWDSAKQALLNAFLPKADYCARYGLSIDDSEWPCAHIPRGLLVDNGEMIWNQPEEHMEPMGVQIQMAAAFRGDWKGVVERRFGIANEKSLHELYGTTKGKLRSRGVKDPRDDAFYTQNEITALLIRLFVDENRTHPYDCLVSKGLVSEDLNPTPLNYWNWCIEHHRDSLSLADPDQARAELLPSIRATVTGEGIECEGRRYSCERAENEDWFVKARKHGSWRLDARADDENSSILWIRPSKRERLIECKLLKKDYIYANLPKADVIYLNEWKKHKNGNADQLAAKIDYNDLKSGIDKKAKIEKNASKPVESKTARKTNIRKNRREEQDRQKNVSTQKTKQRYSSKQFDQNIINLIEKACEDGD